MVLSFANSGGGLHSRARPVANRLPATLLHVCKLAIREWTSSLHVPSDETASRRLANAPRQRDLQKERSYAQPSELRRGKQPQECAGVSPGLSQIRNYCVAYERQAIYSAWIRAHISHLQSRFGLGTELRSSSLAFHATHHPMCNSLAAIDHSEERGVRAQFAP